LPYAVDLGPLDVAGCDPHVAGELFDAMADMTIDTQGLTCPMPILKTKKALSGLPPGAILEVLANDPAAAEDLDSFCRMTGHTLLEQTTDGDTLRFVIKRSADVS
jgi:tRNA 2-thiouridine synthesizing protein A